MSFRPNVRVLLLPYRTVFRAVVAPAPPAPVEPVKKKGPVQVPSRRDSVVKELLVKEGDKVEEGQVLARLDDRLAEADVKISEARVTACKADILASEKTRDESF